jgi:hypothetical protein
MMKSAAVEIQAVEKTQMMELATMEGMTPEHKGMEQQEREGGVGKGWIRNLSVITLAVERAIAERSICIGIS